MGPTMPNLDGAKIDGAKIDGAKIDGASGLSCGPYTTLVH